MNPLSRLRIPHRFPCGRLRGPTRKQMEEARQASEHAARAQVAAQPHREGDESDLSGSELGRLIKRHIGNARDQRDVYGAANGYVILVMKWRRAKGIPMPHSFDLPGFNGGGEPDAELIREWRARIDALDEYMRRAAGTIGWAAALDLMLDDRAPRLQNEPYCVKALTRLEEAIRAGVK